MNQRQKPTSKAGKDDTLQTVLTTLVVITVLLAGGAKDKRFIPYPMPQQVIWFRDLEFSEDGNVCMSNSNLPAYAHEDRVPAFFCIEPEPDGAYGFR